MFHSSFLTSKNIRDKVLSLVLYFK